jgi:hypothetical protein
LERLPVSVQPRATSLLSVLRLWIFAFGLLLGCPQPQAADPSAVATVRSLDDAINAHDAEAVMDMLAVGAVVQDQRMPQTQEQIRGWLGELIRQQIRVELVDQPLISQEAAPRGGTSVTWHARLDMQTYRELGLPSVNAMVRATVVDGQIVFLSIRPDDNWNPALDRTGLT